MKIQHPPYHWIVVALVLAALLLTLSEAHGQGSGAAATFEGRPAMAGAQAGQGALAGPPQGGIGVQGADDAQRQLHLRKPSGLDNMPQGASAGRQDVAVAAKGDVKREVRPARDQSLAKDQRGVKKSKRAARRTISRARHGVAEIDSAATGANR